jgi:hypothetical protein
MFFFTGVGDVVAGILEYPDLVYCDRQERSEGEEQLAGWELKAA